jgi:hypothetical protein
MHLTYRDSDPHTSPVLPASAGEAGAPEIEITPAMIEAGVLAWSQGDEEFDSPDVIVSRIFVAILRARTPACMVSEV